MANSAPPARRLCFDLFELDVRAGELRQRGVRLRLQGQPLQVLATLLNRAGDVVTLAALAYAYSLIGRKADLTYPVIRPRIISLMA